MAGLPPPLQRNALPARSQPREPQRREIDLDSAPAHLQLGEVHQVEELRRSAGDLPGRECVALPAGPAEPQHAPEPRRLPLRRELDRARGGIALLRHAERAPPAARRLRGRWHLGRRRHGRQQGGLLHLRRRQRRGRGLLRARAGGGARLRQLQQGLRAPPLLRQPDAGLLHLAGPAAGPRLQGRELHRLLHQAAGGPGEDDGRHLPPAHHAHAPQQRLRGAAPHVRGHVAQRLPPHLDLRLQHLRAGVRLGAALPRPGGPGAGQLPPAA
mmetsp:Transcript_62347/g.188144  ORF Transcript_62347/g.188144 Transcript_62347/m.188144 type:complete len:270 (+) Transcript_62347:201-1010(+)